jgi:multiple antibiotic resistance protein
VSNERVTFALTSFAALFSIVDPFAVAPIFLAITPQESEDGRRRAAFVASVVSCGILLLFAFLGTRIFVFFGISEPAFHVAGGILLLLVALDMLRARDLGTRQSPEERQAGVEKQDVSITPLAIPLLAGPGAISTVTLLAVRGEHWVDLAILSGVVILVSVLTWIILANSARLVRFLGEIGVKIVTRIMGLLLAGIGAQFILAGVRDFWKAP